MRIVSGLYDSYDDARKAVKVLEDAGVPSDDISIVSRKDGKEDVEGQGNNAAEGAGTGAGIGALAGGAGGLLTGLGMLAIPGVGPVVAAGWLAATAVGAVAGAVVGGAAGGIVGAMIESGVPEQDAHVYAEGVRRGGLYRDCQSRRRQGRRIAGAPELRASGRSRRSPDEIHCRGMVALR